MFIEIEVVSGKILDLLDDKRKLSFYEIKSLIKEPAGFIAQGLEWLVLLRFITEDVITKEYAINDSLKIFREEGLMHGVASRN